MLKPTIPKQLQQLHVAPHRPMFFAGALQVVLVMLWWTIELAGRYSAQALLPLPVIPTVWIHMAFMLYGIFPFFIFGFLMTVYPRWMNSAVIPSRYYISSCVFYSFGMVLFYAGLYTAEIIVAIALLSLLVGWCIASFALFKIFFHANRPGLHVYTINFAMLAGLLGVSAYFAAILSHDTVFYTLARDVGLWLFLMPVVFTVSHRMIPFFSANVLPNYSPIRPRWSLIVMLLCTAGHALLTSINQGRWLFLVDAPLALAALYHSLVWQGWRSLSVPLLAMLHGAFLWCFIGLGLYALQSFCWLVTGEFLFGRAPLHALGIGFISGMMLAMVTRVTLGHSGHRLAVDRFTGYCFLGLNLVAATRVLADFPGLNPTYPVAINLVAGLAWLLFLGAWAAHYLPLYWRKRADGLPG